MNETIFPGVSFQEVEGFSRGLLWGDDSLLSYSTRQAFRQIGASHFLAASGANLAFLQGLLEKVLPRSSSRAFQAVIGAFLALYAWYVNESSLWRAFGMWFLVFFTRSLGRKTAFFWSLGVFMIFLQLFFPELIRQIGFQLSLAAIIGLNFSQILLSGENIIADNGMSRYFRIAKMALCRSFVVTLFIAPVSWWYFGSIAAMSPFSTFVLSPLMSLLFYLAMFLELSHIFEAVGVMLPALFVESIFWSGVRVLSFFVSCLMHIAEWRTLIFMLSSGLFAVVVHEGRKEMRWRRL